MKGGDTRGSKLSGLSFKAHESIKAKAWCGKPRNEGKRLAKMPRGTAGQDQTGPIQSSLTKQKTQVTSSGSVRVRDQSNCKGRMFSSCA